MYHLFNYQVTFLYIDTKDDSIKEIYDALKVYAMVFNPVGGIIRKYS
jgi:hypothetical protein